MGLVPFCEHREQPWAADLALSHVAKANLPTPYPKQVGTLLPYVPLVQYCVQGLGHDCGFGPRLSRVGTCRWP